MKHVLMKNEAECISKIHTLLEGVYTNILPPFPNTEFLKLNSTAICDI